jgi:dynactin 1
LLASTTQPVEVENVPVEGSLETSYLLEQVRWSDFRSFSLLLIIYRQLEAFKGTVRFLRSENSFLKGQDLLRGIQCLPPISDPISRQPTPPLDPSGQSDTDEEDNEEPRTLPTLRTLAVETRMLYKEVIRFSASPRVVDLSALHIKRAEAPHKGMKVWMPRKDNPAQKDLVRKSMGSKTEPSCL